jgi:NTE family protein
MNRFNLTIAFLFISSCAFSQRVGVVLSGGGAKGLAHVGVLKALEENDIPVDYVVGTSMGGIIGGAYAAGMSPEQIEQVVLSEEFLRWVNGFPEEGYNHFFHQNENNPGFLRVNLSLDSILNIQLNTSLASDVSLNFALADLMASASANSKNNFDSLFIPLRVVAADVFTQNQVILKKGSLSDALRATQTVPFFYNPIRVDGKYLFDGGVYNNFPVDVAEAEFKPDVIIGSNVSTKVFNEYPFDIDEKLITRSLLFMLLDKSDPLSVPKNGVYIQPDLEGYTSFDFGKVKSLIDSGYAQTMRQINELKQKISRRVSCDEVAERRNDFNSRNPPIVFNDVQLKGFNSKQSRYIRRVFHFNAKNPKPFFHNRVKNGYFKMVSQDYFNNVYPNILFDTSSHKFQLQLTRRPQKNFQVDFGGVIATRDISNIFLGLHLFNFNNQLLHVYGGFQTGNFNKSAVLRSRIDFPVQFYLEPELAYDNWDYLETDDLLREITPHTVLRRISRKYGVNVGIPIGSFFRATASVHGINNIDRYANRNVFVSSDTLDELHLSGLRTEINLSSSTLNRKQYASRGRMYSFTAQYFNLRENFIPGSTSVDGQLPSIKNHQWFRTKFSAEQYFNAGWFRPGYYAEAVFSNQPFFKNYYGTIINAPGFFSMQDSRTLLLENFRSFNYVAGGLRNVFSIRNRLEFRLEGYLFKPIEHLAEGSNQEAETITDFKKIFFASSASLVLHSPIGPISLSVNYYDDNDNQLGVLLHVGYLLFNKHSIE